MTANATIAEDSPLHSIDPEYFVFSSGISSADYLKGVLHTAQMIARDLGVTDVRGEANSMEVQPEVLGVTWGLTACKVPPQHTRRQWNQGGRAGYRFRPGTS